MNAAKEYPTERIRNVAVLGHASCGKTTLVDALCFTAGMSSRKGNVAEGHALTMTSAEELAQGVSMQLTGAFAEWEGHKINFLDTPGYLDFTGEALAAVHAADAAIVVVGATSGVEVGTEKVWEYCEERGIPRIVVVSMMDKEHADFGSVFGAVKERLADAAVPLQLPIGAGDGFSGAVSTLDGSAHRFQVSGNRGETQEAEIPGELSGEFEKWNTELHETLATLDEDLLDKYLEAGELTADEAFQALGQGVRTLEVVPVLPLAASSGAGTRVLLDQIIGLFPNPAAAVPWTAAEEGEEPVELTASDDEPFTAFVFKTVSEPHVGNLTLFRVCSGSVQNGAQVTNPTRDSQEKLNHLSVPLGKDRPEVSVLHAGDIGVVAKLRETRTNDTLGEPKRGLRVKGIHFPLPEVRLAVRGKTRNDDDKLGEALVALHREDPCFQSAYEPELRQTIIRGMGELHLDVQLERMSRKYGVQVETERPRIAYRETITRKGEAHGRHKKQSGGRGQFGDCWIRIEPLAPGEGGYEFVNSIKGGVIPGRFIPSVDRGIREAAEKGILAGYRAVDFRAECYDGSYHNVDSSDIAFQLAGALAFRKAAEAAGPTILEPIMAIEVTTPEAYMGDIMADVSQRRGKVLGIDSKAGRTVIRARIPQAELYKYAAALRAMTHGRAHHARELVAYEPVPGFEQARIISEVNEED